MCVLNISKVPVWVFGNNSKATLGTLGWSPSFMALQCDYIEQQGGESNRIDCDVPAFISKPPRLRMQCYA